MKKKANNISEIFFNTSAKMVRLTKTSEGKTQQWPVIYVPWTMFMPTIWVC